jgi:F-type H+-transporting ATPase subunit b
VERLGINGGLLLAQIVNFAILFFVLRAMVWGPMVKMLEQRKARIEKGLEDARKAEQALANAERDAQKLIDQRRQEAGKVVDDARIAADGQKVVLLDEAKREAEAIRSKARQEATEERNAILANVRSQVSQMAFAAAERVVEQSLDENKAKSIVSNFFSALPSEMKKMGGDVEVTSALPLSDDEKAKIKSATGANNVSYKVEPGILGGLIVRAGDQVVDGSVRNRLSNLQAKVG